MDPPARNALWRFGYRNPVNYNDNELYCGGFVVHYQKNGGKCGVCGDDYTEKVPRSHEAGGLYGNAIIPRHYITGQIIDIEADLTTNHKGNMQLELCASDNPHTVVTDECLKQNVLPVVATGDKMFKIPEISKKTEIFRWQVKLPEGVSCSHCVIRWTYYAGNTWGKCLNGSESVGCGNQETFINCADISINVNTPTNTISGFNPWLIYFKNNQIINQIATHNFTHNIRNTGTNEINPLDLTDRIRAVGPQTAPVLPWLKRPEVIRTQLCVPTEAYKYERNMAGWCMVNCLKFNATCPPKYCTCVHDCKAIGEWAAVPDADVWCHQNCLKHPSYCPEDRCKCT